MKKSLFCIAIVSLVVLTGCMRSASTPPVTQYVTPSVTLLASVTPETAVPKTATPKATIQSSTPKSADNVTVVTATGMVDIGKLLATPLAITPEISREISWDELKKMPEWVEQPCLTPGAQCLYVQSSKPGQIEVPLPPGQKTFVVPAGTTLVFGTYSGDLVFPNGKQYSITTGFNGALTENTEIKSLVLKDGFALLILRDYGQTEYCLRLTQAMSQKWAPFDGKQSIDGHLFRPDAWSEPVCSGTITTVIDPND